MTTISLRVKDEIKKKMDELAYINWSELLRRHIQEKIAEEEGKERRKNWARVKSASRDIDRLRGLSKPGWSGAEEIRRWRDLR